MHACICALPLKLDGQDMSLIIDSKESVASLRGSLQLFKRKIGMMVLNMLNDDT